MCRRRTRTSTIPVLNRKQDNRPTTYSQLQERNVTIIPLAPPRLSHTHTNASERSDPPHSMSREFSKGHSAHERRATGALVSHVRHTVQVTTRDSQTLRVAQARTLYSLVALQPQQRKLSAFADQSAAHIPIKSRHIMRNIQRERRRKQNFPIYT